MEGGAQAGQRAAALPTPVPLCRHHDQAVSVGPDTVRIHTSGRILMSRWLGHSATRCGRSPCSLFTARSWSQSSQFPACSTANIPTTACAAAVGSLSAAGKGPSLGTSIRRVPHRWTQCSCSAPTPRRVRQGRDPVGLAVPEYNTGLKRGQCTLVRMSGPHARGVRSGPCTVPKPWACTIEPPRAILGSSESGSHSNRHE